MVTFKKVDKQKLCDDLMVENLKLSRRVAALEAEVASLLNNQHSNGAEPQGEICPSCNGTGKRLKGDNLEYVFPCVQCDGTGKLRHC